MSYILGIILLVALSIIIILLSTQLFSKESFDKSTIYFTKLINYSNVGLDVIHPNGITYKLPAKSSLNVEIFNQIRLMYGDMVFGDYVTDLQSNTTEYPTTLYIGRAIAKRQIYATGYPVIKDNMPEIRIHNLTSIPLKFNKRRGDRYLLAEPRTMTTYTGYEQNGIDTGFVLKNEDGIFDDFVINKKITDIYYGIISENFIPKLTERYIII